MYIFLIFARLQIFKISARTFMICLVNSTFLEVVCFTRSMMNEINDRNSLNFKSNFNNKLGPKLNIEMTFVNH